MFLAELEQPKFAQDVFELQVDDREKMRIVLSEVGQRTIDYLKSLTGEMRPPAKVGGSERSAHPGHWADVTGNLSDSYGWRIEELPDGPQLVLFNSASYAVYLEGHNGFFVLTGVTDPGGPVDTFLRKVIPEVAPGWSIA